MSQITTPAELQSALLAGLERNASLAVTIGIVLIVCGALSIAAPLVAGLAVTITVGLLLAIGGAAQCVLAFKAGAFGRGLLILLIGLLTAVVGVFLFSQPRAGLAEITIFLAMFFVLTGVLEIVSSLDVRPAPGWRWLAMNGVVTLLLGVLIWAQFPLSEEWAVGVLFGIRLLMAGWVLVAIGGALRRGTRSAAG